MRWPNSAKHISQLFSNACIKWVVTYISRWTFLRLFSKKFSKLPLLIYTITSKSNKNVSMTVSRNFPSQFDIILTHRGRVTHICISKLTIIGSDNGLSPGQRQAIIWTNAGILLIWPLGTNFGEISIDIQTFSFKKIHFKMSSGKWRPFCLGLDVLTHCGLVMSHGIGKLACHWSQGNVSHWFT